MQAARRKPKEALRAAVMRRLITQVPVVISTGTASP